VSIDSHAHLRKNGAAQAGDSRRFRAARSPHGWIGLGHESNVEILFKFQLHAGTVSIGIGMIRSRVIWAA
jgi:hypothetical protein